MPFLSCHLALGVSAVPSGRAGGQQPAALPPCAPRRPRYCDCLRHSGAHLQGRGPRPACPLGHTREREAPS